MQVFKAFFKVIKKNLPQMFIYLGIFIALSILFMGAGVGREIVEFEHTRPNIAVFDKDGSKLSGDLTDYIGGYSNIVDIDEDDEAVRDALFYRRISYALYIPEGFFGSFPQEGIQLRRTVIPDSYSTVYIDRVVSKYLKTYEAYAKFLPDADIDTIISNVRSNLDKAATVRLEAFGEEAVVQDGSVYYFNYFAYSLLSIILLGVCAFMITFQNMDLKRRNASSPVSALSMNLQLILGNFLFALLAWGIMYGISFILFGAGTTGNKAFLYGVNSFVFALVCLSLSFLVANVVRSKNAQAGVVNVLALGLSFLSGVFVPQFLLGDMVLRIASFAPAYWYVRANHVIDEGIATQTANLSHISDELIAQIGFAVVFLVISMIAIRRRRTAEN